MTSFISIATNIFVTSVIFKPLYNDFYIAILNPQISCSFSIIFITNPELFLLIPEESLSISNSMLFSFITLIVVLLTSYLVPDFSHTNHA
jgi:hypothetical protein